MNLITKILSSIVTLTFAVVGGLWTAYTVITSTMDSKIAEASTNLRIERSAQIGEVKATVVGVKERLDSMDKKLDILIERNK